MDDCSTEPFDKEVKPYEDKLNIKKVKTESNKGPGMARQFGIDNADGEWIVFCDHDDNFIANTFNRIRTVIRNNPSRNIIQARFEEVTEKGETIPYSFEKGMNWVHGKFFRKSFLNANKLKFKEGLETHEDIYFSILTRVATEHFNAPVLNCDLIIYDWVNRPESLSHRRETGLDLFYNHFEDYVTSAFGPITALKDVLSIEEKLSQSVSSFLFVYFYVQGFKQLKKEQIDRDEKILLDCAKTVLQLTGFKAQQITEIILSNASIFCMIREKSFDSVGYFFEYDAWAEILNTAEEELNAGAKEN